MADKEVQGSESMIARKNGKEVMKDPEQEATNTGVIEDSVVNPEEKTEKEQQEGSLNESASKELASLPKVDDGKSTEAAGSQSMIACKHGKEVAEADEQTENIVVMQDMEIDAEQETRKEHQGGSSNESASKEPALSTKVDDDKDTERKTFYCNYCSAKFSTSQALGGHQNAHRYERNLEKKKRANNPAFLGYPSYHPPSYPTMSSTGPVYGPHNRYLGVRMDSGIHKPNPGPFGGGSQQWQDRWTNLGNNSNPTLSQFRSAGTNPNNAFGYNRDNFLPIARQPDTGMGLMLGGSYNLPINNGLVNQMPPVSRSDYGVVPSNLGGSPNFPNLASGSGGRSVMQWPMMAKLETTQMINGGSSSSASPIQTSNNGHNGRPWPLFHPGGNSGVPENEHVRPNAKQEGAEGEHDELDLSLRL